jgi:hypothetical protein
MRETNYTTGPGSAVDLPRKVTIELDGAAHLPTTQTQTQTQT